MRPTRSNFLRGRFGHLSSNFGVEQGSSLASLLDSLRLIEFFLNSIVVPTIGHFLRSGQNESSVPIRNLELKGNTPMCDAEQLAETD